MTVLLKREGFFYRNRYVFLAFLLPFFLMLLAYAAAGFYPFGQNQVAVIDMYHQYYPFINELHEKLQNGGSLLYSWDGGLGTNFLTLLSYYAASPLYFLTILVPDAWLMEAVTLIILIKIGLAGAFMAVYLRGMHGRCDCAPVAFSTLYALCAYVMGYYWCLMWLDVVALLPLCMLGLNRLIDRGDFKLYTLSLAAMMLTNYYIGGMVCIFILFYYPILYFSRAKKRGVKGCLRVTGKAVLCSFTGIFLSGITLLPTFLNMQNTYYIDSEMPAESTFYHSLMDILTNLFPETQLTVREGLPNIYCGLLCVILLICFLLSKSISLRKKILNGIMLAFLIVSLNYNKLDFIWHGLHFPNQLPFRYSFVVSFLLIVIAFEAFIYIREISQRQLIAIGAGIALYILLAQKLYSQELKPEFAYVSLFLLLLYVAFLAAYRTRRFHEPLMCLLLLVFVACEMMNHTAISVETVSSTNRDEYFAQSNEVKKVVEDTRKKDKGFYRMELVNPLILNAPMLYGYPGVSEFSSTVNGSVSYLMEHIGLEAEDVKNRYNYVMTTPVANAMLNVKYLISRDTTIEGEDALTLTGGEQMTTLYENKYDLSVGYMVDAAVMENWNFHDENPFTVLNDFVKLSTNTDRDVFYRTGAPSLVGSGVSLGEYQEDGRVSCAPLDSDNPVSAELTFTSSVAQQLYVYVETSGAETITALKEDGTEIELREDCGAAVSVGKCRAGETVTVKIQYEAGQAGEIRAYAYGLDETAWNSAYAMLDDETLNVKEYNDTEIKGTVQAKEDGYFVTSIPYEKGWTVEVDGKEVTPEAFGDAFLAIPLKAGTHEIDLHYLPEGLIPGILLTLCGVGILLALCFMRKHRTWEPEPEAQPICPVYGPVYKSGLHRRRFL